MLSLPTNVAYVLMAAMAVLTAGGVLRWIDSRRRHDAATRTRLASIVVWWVLIGLLLLAVSLGLLGGVLLTAAASLLALQEYLGVTDGPRRYGGARYVAYLLLVVHYVVVYLGRWPAACLLTPTAALASFAVWYLVVGRTDGYLAAVSGLLWGLVLTVVGLSHAAFLWLLPAEANPACGGAGWFVYLLLLTQLNDIAQALWGRALGRHKVTPRVSPGKTWEGLLLGVATTIVLAVLLAPLLTPFAAAASDGRGGIRAIAYLPAIVAGAIIGLGGFAGDLNISALKRDLGLKDSGNLLPSQGGILDRLDSLTFAAPLFFYYVYALYGGR